MVIYIYLLKLEPLRRPLRPSEHLLQKTKLTLPGPEEREEHLPVAELSRTQPKSMEVVWNLRLDLRRRILIFGVN